MKINKDIIAKDLDSPLQLIEIDIEDGYITGEVLVGSGCYVKGKVYKMPYINFVLTTDKPKKGLEPTKVILQDGLIQFNKDKIEKSIDKFNTPKHYDNSKGTLYQVATERGWNSYLFDIVKRLERAEKKGEFKTDLEKSKVVIDLWLKESEL